MAKRIWVTAGDTNVCPFCEGEEGNIYIDPDFEPADISHPSCRCHWDDYEDTQTYLPLTRTEQMIQQGFLDQPYKQRLSNIPVDMNNIQKPSIIQRLHNWFFNWKS